PIVAVFEHPVTGITLRAPAMAQCRLISRSIIIVEEYIFLGERMVVRCDISSEYREARVSIALRHIPENLIVRAILFDDVKVMFDWGFLGEGHRNRIVSGSLVAGSRR